MYIRPPLGRPPPAAARAPRYRVPRYLRSLAAFFVGSDSLALAVQQQQPATMSYSVRSAAPTQDVYMIGCAPFGVDESANWNPFGVSAAVSDEQADAVEAGGPPQGKLAPADPRIIELGCQQLALTAVKESKMGRLDPSVLHDLERQIKKIERKVKALPVDGPALDSLPPPLRAELNVASGMFRHADLLALTGEDATADTAERRSGCASPRWWTCCSCRSGRTSTRCTWPRSRCRPATTSARSC